MQEKQEVAQALSARVNHAYQTLLDPLLRAEYILERNQLPVAESESVQDMMFMAEIMEARETIDEAEDSSQVQELYEENEGVQLVPSVYRAALLTAFPAVQTRSRKL